MLDLVRQFIYEHQEEDEQGRKTGQRFLIFPRCQQLDCVRILVSDADSPGFVDVWLNSDLREQTRLSLAFTQRTPLWSFVFFAALCGPSWTKKVFTGWAEACRRGVDNANTLLLALALPDPANSL